MADRKKKQDSVRVPRTEERQHRSATQTALHSAGALIKLIFGIIGTLLLVVLCTGIIFSVLFANYLQHDCMRKKYGQVAIFTLLLYRGKLLTQ